MNKPRSDIREFYSKASRSFQDMHDSRRLADQLQKTRLHTRFNKEDISLITSAEMFFIATADANGHPDCSVKGGNAGFVSVDNETRLSFLDYDGNGMFRSLGNIEDNPQVGLLFLAFDGDLRKLRINGAAKVIKELQTDVPNALRIEVTAREIFPNCPRYLPEMKISKSSIYNPARGYKPPDPLWKAKPDLKDHLPHHHYQHKGEDHGGV